jgi:hypothetical protein
VSDSFDQRVLTTYLEEYFGDFLFDTFQPFHFYVGREGDSIGVPQTGPREAYIKAIDALPLVQSPEVRLCRWRALWHEQQGGMAMPGVLTLSRQALFQQCHPFADSMHTLS